MATCPTCASPLEQSLATLFCASCRMSLQPRAALASSLGLREDSEHIVNVRDRFARPLGPCAACSSGELEPGRLLGEAVASCNACAAVWISGNQLARMR